MVFGLETPFTEPHDFLFNMYHPKGTRNHAGVNDPKLTEMIEKQARTRRQGRAQEADLRDPALPGRADVLPAERGRAIASAGIAPNVRDFYPRSDYGLGAEVIPKLWLDK